MVRQHSNLFILGLCITILLLNYFSCHAVKGHVASGIFQIVDSLMLPAIPESPVQTLCAKYFEDGDAEYLFWSNRNRNSIEIFNLRSKTHEKTIRLPRDGPYGIPNIYAGFSVLALDTIIVSSSQAYGKLFCIDTFGKYYDIIQYANPSSDTTGNPGNQRVNLNSHYNGDVYRIYNQLVIPYRTPTFNYIPSEEEVKRSRRFGIYNFEKRTLSNSTIGYLSEIFGNPKIFSYSTNTFLNGKLYYHHLNSDKILYTSDFFHERYKSIPSEYQTDYVPWSDSESPYETVKRTFYYQTIKADPYKNLLYRIVKLPVRIDDMDFVDGEKELQGELNRVSVMVLDEKLNVLGEQLFENKHYSWNECFVTKKGLHILRAPTHPHYSESILTFDIYVFNF